MFYIPMDTKRKAKEAFKVKFGEEEFTILPKLNECPLLGIRYYVEGETSYAEPVGQKINRTLEVSCIRKRGGHDAI